MDAGAALDTLIFIDLAYAILVVGNRVYRAGLLTRALQMCDRVVRAGICALAALLTLVRINMGTGISAMLIAPKLQEFWHALPIHFLQLSVTV